MKLMHIRSFFLSLRWYVVTVIALFLLSGCLSFFFPEKFLFFDSYLARLFAEAGALEGLALFFFILKNNVLAACVGMLGGIVFGIIPLGICSMNGLVLGYVASRVSESVGFFSLWRLVPHGIFELPALFLALALGLRLGVASAQMVRSLFFGGKDDFMEVFRLALLTFVLLVIPLLLIAGIIETVLIGAGV